MIVVCLYAFGAKKATVHSILPRPSESGVLTCHVEIPKIPQYEHNDQYVLRTA